MLEKGFTIKKAKNGKGLFATREFTADEILLEIRGVFMTGYEDEDIDELIRLNTIRFSKQKYISPEGEMGDYVNHSCKPSVKVVKKQKKLFLIAIEDIKKGDEVVFDYSTITAPDDTWEMVCECGNEDCRGVISQFKKLPRKLKDKYLALGMVPKYILE